MGGLAGTDVKKMAVAATAVGMRFRVGDDRDDEELDLGGRRKLNGFVESLAMKMRFVL
jgi:urease beta subunit